MTKLKDQIAQTAIEQDEGLERAEDKADASKMLGLVHAGKELGDLTQQKNELDAQLSPITDRIKQLKEDVIPGLMREAGLVNAQNKGSFTVPGFKIHLETRVDASIPVETRSVFLAWLKKRKDDKGMIVETVNAQTLSAFVRGLREEGKKDPPGIAVFERTKAKLVRA